MYRQALDFDPTFAEAHCNLGLALRDQGHFTKALRSLQRGHQLGSRHPNWSYPCEKALAQLPEAERAAWQTFWADLEKVQKRASARRSLRAPQAKASRERQQPEFGNSGC
jgi:hypothetical protein